jgi:endonuclease YncB( thermonuclease family)
MLARVEAMKATPLALLCLAAFAAADASAQPRKPPPATEPKETRSTECAAMGELPKVWDGQAFAVDGQTLGGTGLKAHLRLWGIQAPELRDTTRVENVPGMRARAFLADLLAKADHKVKCRPARFDRECRIVAQCSVGDAGDLGGSMIAGGMAYGFELDEALPWETRAGQRYADAEVEARKARRGLWPAWLGDQ